ncbi:MAG: DUF4442 domain-containing protein [Flavobacteriaceae bacterium]
MSMYQQLSRLGERFFSRAFLFKHGFNLSPMYRRSTGRVVSVSEDLFRIEVKLKLSYKNRNYVNTIFGGSMFASVDPFPMVQLINLIGPHYVVWDKAAHIRFLRPGDKDLQAIFQYTPQEVADIQKQVAAKKEIEIVKTTQLIDPLSGKIHCEVDKTIYIADKSFFKAKQKKRLKEKATQGKK